MARKQSPALTDAESEVMAVLWRLQRASVGEVVAALNRTRAVSYSTVQTILRILETKGYVTHEKVARAFIYEPVVDERQAEHEVRPAALLEPSPLNAAPAARGRRVR